VDLIHSCFSPSTSYWLGNFSYFDSSLGRGWNRKARSVGRDRRMQEARGVAAKRPLAYLLSSDPSLGEALARTNKVMR
jgi:hypothetical protein